MRSMGLAVVGLALGLGLLPAAPDDPAARADAILARFREEFVLLTPGTGPFPASFRMGSEGNAPAEEQPAHPVTLSRPFALARYEVTQELYQVIAGRNPSRWKGPRNSVEMVSWPEAAEFCRKVTAALRQRQLLAPGEIIRLPSEAEWEYACRAGTMTRYAFGDDVQQLGDHAWFKGNSKGEDPPVGRKKPNAWKLYDMHGYVWEWCLDAWHADYKNAPSDGSAWDDETAGRRVIRGGSWADGADECRCAFRRPMAAEQRSDAVGFRCVKTAGP